MMLHLQTPRTNRLRFLAGQSLTLSVTGSTANFRGDYPIASCPCDDRNLLFHIRRDDDDEFARRVFAGALMPNDAVSLFGPFGDFVLRKDSTNDISFVVCDTGFAPIKSLIEHAVASDMPGTLRLLWAATCADGHYLENQCRSWADALDTFSYATLDAADPQAAGTAAAQSLLAEGDFVSRDIYVVGPAAFVSAAARRAHRRRPAGAAIDCRGDLMRPAQLSFILDREFLSTAAGHHTPVMLWGPPGVGKSQIVAQVAARHGVPVIDIRLSQMEPSDLRGIPFRVGDTVQWAVPAHAARCQAPLARAASCSSTRSPRRRRPCRPPPTS